MAETKNLCAQIPIALHSQVCEAREQSGLIEEALETAEQQAVEDTPELEEGPSSEEAGTGLCEPSSEGSGLHTQEVPSWGGEEPCEAGEGLPAAQDE